MNKRFLILTADDYGMCRSANEAVEHLFDEGCLSAASLMTPCPWATDAINRAKINKNIRIGLHLTLTSETKSHRWGPITAKRAVSLQDSHGFLFNNIEDLHLNAKESEVSAELEEQLTFMLKHGMAPTHVDCHMFFAGKPGVPEFFIEKVFDICAKGPWPFRLPRTLKLSGIIDRLGHLQRYLDRLIAVADEKGIMTIDSTVTGNYFLDKHDGYSTVKAAYLRLIKNMEAGTTEIFLHPSRDSDELREMFPNWRERVYEYQFLLDPELKCTLNDEGIQLIRR